MIIMIIMIMIIIIIIVIIHDFVCPHPRIPVSALLSSPPPPGCAFPALLSPPSPSPGEGGSYCMPERSNCQQTMRRLSGAKPKPPSLTPILTPSFESNLPGAGPIFTGCCF